MVYRWPATSWKTSPNPSSRFTTKYAVAAPGIGALVYRGEWDALNNYTIAAREPFGQGVSLASRVAGSWGCSHECRHERGKGHQYCENGRDARPRMADLRARIRRGQSHTRITRLP